MERKEIEMENNKMDFSFTVEEVKKVLIGLSALPYRDVSTLIASIVENVNRQSKQNEQNGSTNG